MFHCLNKRNYEVCDFITFWFKENVPYCVEPIINSQSVLVLQDSNNKADERWGLFIAPRQTDRETTLWYCHSLLL